MNRLGFESGLTTGLYLGALLVIATELVCFFAGKLL